jgi:hypothetical protein
MSVLFNIVTVQSEKTQEKCAPFALFENPFPTREAALCKVTMPLRAGNGILPVLFFAAISGFFCDALFKLSLATTVTYSTSPVTATASLPESISISARHTLGSSVRTQPTIKSMPQPFNFA